MGVGSWLFKHIFYLFYEPGAKLAQNYAHWYGVKLKLYISGVNLFYCKMLASERPDFLIFNDIHFMLKLMKVK